ncbi:PREDICTED: protein PXR1-like isoform X1 [Populus euphratica]|uniref:Protein PXR1-like isoform X1 n=1 Tax=Populus euphratica TaxID=75702 RepID=A0AAJ6X219_POPEU|nr:PREDICTED: protein PXR1-like isoform X1 [Populus euphratica]
MKTVTGKITDSAPVSISKAASILSKFVSSENGASQALNAYLRRATAAFDELSRLHSKSERRKHEKDSSLIRSVEASQSELVNNSEQMLKKEVKEEGSVGDEEIESKKERKRKSKRKRKGDLAEHTEKSNGIKKEKAEVEENGSVVDKIEIREEEEKKKRKRKGGEVEVKEEREEEEKDGLEEEGQRKRRRRKQVDDN